MLITISLKTSENLRFSYIFRGYRNEIFCENGLRSNILILRETSFKLKFKRKKTMIKDANAKYFCKVFI